MTQATAGYPRRVSVKVQYWWWIRNQRPCPWSTTHYKWTFTSNAVWTKGPIACMTHYSSQCHWDERGDGRQGRQRSEVGLCCCCCSYSCSCCCFMVRFLLGWLVLFFLFLLFCLGLVLIICLLINILLYFYFLFLFFLFMFSFWRTLQKLRM